MAEQACLFNIQHYSIHDGPGIRSVVFFKGCPLRCFWCANPESQSGLPEQMYDAQTKRFQTVGSYQTLDEIVADVMKDEPFYLESNGGVTLSGGEPLFQAEFVLDLLKALKKRHIDTACETTGFVNSEIFASIIKWVDHLYLDIKHYDTTKHRSGIKVGNQQIIDNLKLAVAQHLDLIVRIPIIPNFNDSLTDDKAFAQLFQDVGVTTIEVLPFHQFGEKKYEALNRPYLLKGVRQLHSEDLKAYQTVFQKAGMSCIVR